MIIFNSSRYWFTPFVTLSLVMLFLSACGSQSGVGSLDRPQSNTTGWNYNDKSEGSFYVKPTLDQKIAPGLVFIQGGTFLMGQTLEDIMGDWNNVPKRVTVNSFLIDQYEISNLNYREYLNWINDVFAGLDMDWVLKRATPDTLCWRSELSYNEPFVEYYFRHPAYSYYPVVGVSWKQAHDFCVWRTDRVNQKTLIQNGFQNKNVLKQELNGGGQENFNTKAYLMGLYSGIPTKSTSIQLLDAHGVPKDHVGIEDGLLYIDYRLPTEAEWEYAALANISNNPLPSLEGDRVRGEEVIANTNVYSWQNSGYDNLRATKEGNWQGSFLANFKRGTGDYMGVTGGLNDNSAFTAPINSFFPNAFGLYNMSGNVSEWVFDVYRQLDASESDLQPFRGNDFKSIDTTGSGQSSVDAIGHVNMVEQQDSTLTTRLNYQHAYAVNYDDGDDASGVSYGYGLTTLVNDHSRVIKGGSWADLPYWLSPGTRRFMDESQDASTVGFRCAMSHLGSPQGVSKSALDGNYFPARRTK
ncbi:MAG: SUMF1/EgtB/PvdO family nonheme iron enzyme [Phycisphaerales bacterium]|nr:SUMF1/EgtB/PvdO family nonheme iron enzyme [Phycisphaerales bacterium]